MIRASFNTSPGAPDSRPFTGTTALGEGATNRGKVPPEYAAHRFQTASSNPNRTEGAARPSPRTNAPYGSTQSSVTSQPVIDPASRRSCSATSSRFSLLKPGSGALSPQPSEPSSPDNLRRRPSRRWSVVPSSTNGREKGRL